MARLVEMNRPLTLDEIPGELLAELGLRPGGATGASYRCSDPVAFLIPLTEVAAPTGRRLNREALASVLRGFKDGDAIPPVVVFREPEADTATLLDGLHRLRASAAVGYTMIPCTQPSRGDAEVVYCYAPTNSD